MSTIDPGGRLVDASGPAHRRERSEIEPCDVTFVEENARYLEVVRSFLFP